MLLKALTLAPALLTSLASAQAFQKTEFQSSRLVPPIWLIGDYYVVAKPDTGETFLYIVPAIYNKVDEDNDYNPRNGQIMQIFAQLEAPPREVETEGDDEEAVEIDAPWYESWSCNMKYFTDVTDKTIDDIVKVQFFEGYRLISSQIEGTYESSNS